MFEPFGPLGCPLSCLSFHWSQQYVPVRSDLAQTLRHCSNTYDIDQQHACCSRSGTSRKHSRSVAMTSLIITQILGGSHDITMSRNIHFRTICACLILRHHYVSLRHYAKTSTFNGWSHSLCEIATTCLQLSGQGDLSHILVNYFYALCDYTRVMVYHALWWISCQQHLWHKEGCCAHLQMLQATSHGRMIAIAASSFTGQRLGSTQPNKTSQHRRKEML